MFTNSCVASITVSIVNLCRYTTRAPANLALKIGGRGSLPRVPSPETLPLCDPALDAAVSIDFASASASLICVHPRENSEKHGGGTWFAMNPVCRHALSHFAVNIVQCRKNLDR